MLIVNKLILIYFAWFVHNFVNYKYKILLKRDDVCLMPLSTIVTLSTFDDGKECCGDVVATLWQRRRLTSPQLSFSTVPPRCDNVNHDVHNVAVPAGF